MWGTDQGLCRPQSFWHPRLIARRHRPETATNGLFWQIGCLEVCVSSHTGQGRRGLILSHEMGGMVMDASYLCEFRSPLRFRVGGRAFGRGIGGDEVSDFGEAVVEP